MLRRWLTEKPLYPFLLVVYPVLHLYETNFGSVPLSAIVLPLLVCIGFAAALFGICIRIPYTRDKAALLTALAVIFIFGYGAVYLAIPNLLPGLVFFRHRWLLIIWIVIGILAFGSALRRTYTARPNTILAWNAFASFLVFSALVSVGSKLIVGINHQRARLPEVEVQAPTDRPDVYYIILDGYGRQDMLGRYHDFNNSQFINYLKGKGFWIADQSQSNYLETNLSIPSSLNFSYLAELAPEREVFAQWFTHAEASELIARSAVFSTFKKAGYKVINVSSAYELTNNLGGADVNLGYQLDLDDFDAALLGLTVLRPFMMDYQLITGPQLLQRFKLLERASQIQGPKFVFTHILSPHPPYQFDAMGRPVHLDQDQQGWRNRASYAEQVRFDNDQLKGVIDAILSKATKPPIIVLQGDHGPSLIDSTPTRAWNTDWPDDQLATRPAILNAFLVPSSVRRQLYSSITPVNTFRAIFNGLFQAKLPLEPDETYYSFATAPLELVPIPRRPTPPVANLVPKRP